MKKLFPFVFIFFGLLMSHCTKKVIATSSKPDTNKISKYDEDLSSVRPKYRTETASKTQSNTKQPDKIIGKNTQKLQADVTDKLNVILDSIAVRNKIIKSAPGFRVQIYVGESREEALEARANSYNLLKDETPYFIPTLPSYRVRVGDFLDRLEAQKAYTILVKVFPTALVVPDKIEIKRYGE